MTHKRGGKRRNAGRPKGRTRARFDLSLRPSTVASIDQAAKTARLSRSALVDRILSDHITTR